MQLILYFSVWPRGKYRQVLFIASSTEVSVRKKTIAKFRVFLYTKVYFYSGTHVNKKITYFCSRKSKTKDKVAVAATKNQNQTQTNKKAQTT